MRSTAALVLAEQHPSSAVPVALMVLGLLAAAWFLVRTRNARLGEDASTEELGSTVLVPVSRPRSARPLGALAAALAAPDGGRVVGLSVLDSADGAARAAASETVRALETSAGEGCHDASGKLRIAEGVAAGVLFASVEEQATIVLLGWPAEGRDGGALRGPVLEVVEQVATPVLVARLEGGSWERVVLHVGSATARPAGLAAVRVAAAVARRTARTFASPAVVAGEPPREVAEFLADLPTVQSPADGRLGEPGDLTIVAADPASLAHTLEWVGPSGDVIVALPHGGRRHRALLPAAARLYQADSTDRRGRR